MQIDRTRSRRRWRLAAAGAALVGAYALAGFFGLPWLIRTIAGDEVDKLGRKLEIGAIRFNPFSFELGIDALKLSEADGKPLLAFDALYANLDILHSIIERGAVLTTLRWTAPDIALLIDADGSINWNKLIPPSPDPAKPESAGVPHVRIGELIIEKGRVGLEDRSRPQAFSTTLAPIEFTLRDFRTEPSYENLYEFSAAATSGETLSWSGTFSVQPIASKGHFSLSKLRSSTLVAYLQNQLPVHLVSGSGELSGDYQLTLAPSLALDLQIPLISLHQLALAETAQAAPTVSIAELALQGLSVSLAKREANLQRIAITQFRADVQRNADGSVNLSRLYTPPTAGTKPADDASAAPWRATIQRVDLIDNDIRITDHGVQPAIQIALNPLTASITGLSSELAAPLHVDASVNINRKGTLRLQGDVGLQPVSTKLSVDAAGIDLSVLQPYLATRTSLRLKTGLLAVKGELAYLQKEAPSEPQLDFSGAAGLSQLNVEDRALKQDLLSWRDLRLAGIDYHSQPARLSVERVDLVEPSARVTISPSREINVTSALVPPGAAPASASAPQAAASENKSAPALPWQIKQIHVSKGQMRFTDLSIDPNFSAGIFALGGDITQLSSDAAVHAKIELAGKVDEFAPVLISGELVPSRFDHYSDISLSFRNMDLVRFNPYSGRFAGYNIVKGKLTTDLHYQIRDRELVAEHHVVLDQLEFGDATGSKDAVPLPIKLAVALLKDRHGVIDLALPVRGSLDDPAFHVGAMVGKVLTNLLAKAVTAPFSALAALFGGGDELAYVNFAPGSAALSEAESAKLDHLAQALIERPALKLDIPMAEAAEQDAAALARQELDRRVPAAASAGASPQNTPSQRLRALEQLHRELLVAAPGYDAMPAAGDADARLAARTGLVETALLQKLAPDAAAIDRLAADRARSVQAAVLAHTDIPPERIFLTGRHAASLGGDGAVRMELSLQ
ncbi:MAG: hypothetical protein JWQ90_5167 [Hydrocarboniphaga sp.]|uniref:DUF748 domain-containing protein n=1 Tax=Hydrocarboniphaga sp. TaxID=2033016 RepID=UPI002621376E|nr:DUF748 domain-containing protein [Hydrocarboniphaga sp.]MDB5972717.1 hypothetical protein [Hydrocarboniphaga sp.]